MAFASQRKSGAGAQLSSWMQAAALAVAGCLYAAGAVCEPVSEKVPPSMITIVEKDNGQTVDLRLGNSVRIVLPENATTGYRWTIDRYDDEFIEAMATESHYTGKVLGSGGNVEFTFKGKKMGTGEIVLKEWRHWEGDASITRRFCVNLNIVAGP